MVITITLWITFQEGRNVPAGPSSSCSVSCTRLADLPGASGVWMEFHPLIILYITTKITQKTTILTGISNVSQSILPSLSTCFSRLDSCTRNLLGLSTQQLWLKSAILSVEEIPGRARCSSWPWNKIPENWYSSREFGSLGLYPAPPVLQLSTGYPHVTVDNSSGVWEF